MLGKLIVGKGGTPAAEHAVADETRRLYTGVGVVVATDIRKSRLIVNHEEIKDFMAPMEMSYLVSPATLLRDLQPGDKIHFTIDADKRAIVDIARIGP